jgi:hypothetical protein
MKTTDGPRISYSVAVAVQPEAVKELKEACRHIYDEIAMDAFGVNGATDKDGYVCVMADHLCWRYDTLTSDEARKLYNNLTFSAQAELIGQTYQGSFIREDN